jgi:hypothetical protein
VVSDLADADGIVDGVISTISSDINATTTVPQIARPEDKESQDFSDTVIATEYVSTAVVNMTLIRRKDSTTLWSQSFNQRKPYPSSNRFGLPGTTSMLINDSQHQMALAEIAKNMANDIYDNMLEAF